LNSLAFNFSAEKKPSVWAISEALLAMLGEIMDGLYFAFVCSNQERIDPAMHIYSAENML